MNAPALPANFSPKSFADFPVLKQRVVPVNGGAIIILQQYARAWFYNGQTFAELHTIPEQTP